LGLVFCVGGHDDGCLLVTMGDFWPLSGERRLKDGMELMV
jgi:hypothetical protein